MQSNKLELFDWEYDDGSESVQFTLHAQRNGYCYVIKSWIEYDGTIDEENMFMSVCRRINVNGKIHMADAEAKKLKFSLPRFEGLFDEIYNATRSLVGYCPREDAQLQRADDEWKDRA